MEETLGSIRPHRITIQDRKTAGITGVSDCVSFDENEVVLDTDMGLLTIRGKDLHVNRLTLEKGEVDRVVMKGETLTVTLKKQQKMGTPATLYTTLMEDASELVKRLEKAGVEDFNR